MAKGIWLLKMGGIKRGDTLISGFIQTLLME